MLAMTGPDIREKLFAASSEILDELVPGITAKSRGLFPRVEEKSESSEVGRRRRERFSVGESQAPAKRYCANSSVQGVA